MPADKCSLYKLVHEWFKSRIKEISTVNYTKKDNQNNNSDPESKNNELNIDLSSIRPPANCMAQKRSRYQFRQILGVYQTLLNSKLLTVRFINEAIGVGVFAKQYIRSGNQLMEIVGHRSTHVSGDWASRHLYCTVAKTCYKKRGTRAERVVKQQKYILVGPVAFINHACEDCANLQPFLTDRPRQTMWTRMQVTRDIPAGGELLVCYDHSDECKLPCLVCGN